MNLLLATLREEAIASQIVWRDHPRACTCTGDHPHHGDVTASQLADLVDADFLLHTRYAYVTLHVPTRRKSWLSPSSWVW